METLPTTPKTHFCSKASSEIFQLSHHTESKTGRMEGRRDGRERGRDEGGKNLQPLF